MGEGLLGKLHIHVSAVEKLERFILQDSGRDPNEVVVSALGANQGDPEKAALHLVNRNIIRKTPDWPDPLSVARALVKKYTSG